ncbi:MAG: helix-turn-helix transcriptional regulator [Chloroflexi bacterium]|nr:helix-turn-helix transcriptional regulator [Chloroflexota bacterium]
MIKNERQYRITRAQADGLSRTLESLSRRAGVAHPLIAKAQEDALKSQIEDLQSELRDYESLLSGGFRPGDLQTIAKLPTMLIRARIAQGLSQKDLAKRLGLKEQQIQRYEATDYASASLTRIREVAGALGASEGQ